MLQLAHVYKSYHKTSVVEDLSFSLLEGEALGLIGSNGAGKSTTLSMIATLLKPDKGDILFDGVSVIEKPQQIRSKLGYVPQNIALYENLTGMDNLKFWGQSYHLHGKKLTEAIERVKDIITLSKQELSQKVATYSGGMKRRLNIGVALLHQPRLVIMDEPTVGIDLHSRNVILNTILEINKRGTTILYTGHYLEEIDQICNKICIMNKGKSVVFGSKQEILSKYNNQTLEEIYVQTINEAMLG